MTNLKLVAISFIALALSACGGSQPAQPSGRAAMPPRHTHVATATPQQISPESKAYSLGQLAAILQAANEGEVAQAELAQRNGTATVREMAQHMITDHGAALRDQEALLQQRGIAPEETEVSRQIRANSDAHIAQLSTLSGEEFDFAYAKAQFAQHDKLFAMLGEVIPTVDDVRFRAHLMHLRGSIENHLAHARALEQETFAALQRRQPPVAVR